MVFVKIYVLRKQKLTEKAATSEDSNQGKKVKEGVMSVFEMDTG